MCWEPTSITNTSGEISKFHFGHRGLEALLLRGSIPDSLGRLAFVKLQFFGQQGWLMTWLVKLRDGVALVYNSFFVHRLVFSDISSGSLLAPKNLKAPYQRLFK